MRKPRQAEGGGAARAVLRAAILVVALGGTLVLGAGAARPATHPASTITQALLGQREPVCESHASLCRDVFKTPGDAYVGHDEPSVAFRSSLPGSGNDMTYTVRLPKEPPTIPQNDGSGGTWNFELRPTFWFGLTLCDTESAPEFTKHCTPDSDANDLVGTNPAAPDYIGKHPGNAFLELQFYGPGYVPQFEGFGCAATQYCAAMTIDSVNEDQNTHTFNTPACDNYILGGSEPINWAYVTKSGRSQAPADPLFTGTFDNPNFAAVNPNLSKDLLMNPGDRIFIHMHDTPLGYRVDLTDQTTHQSGSMTASVSNGFAHVLYTPNATRCTSRPYAFHAEYSTANPRGNTWSAHTTNVSYSDEIGHFEHCLELDQNFNCAVAGSDDPAGLDADDVFCVPGSDALVVHINGCFQADDDFDGPSYQNDWPGTNSNPTIDRRLHPEPVMFTSPTTREQQYSTIQFEADLAAIEATCSTVTGIGCVNPPPGAQFYPFFSTRVDNGLCQWQEGGNFIPGTANNYGGSSATEFTHLISQVFPGAGFMPITRFENFNSGDLPNGCPAFSTVGGG